MTSIQEKTSLDISCKVGRKDLKNVFSKNGLVKKHQTDRHIYLNGELKIVIECKSYLDSCYYTRSLSDMLLFKKQFPSVMCFIVSLEDSVNLDTKNFYDDVFDKSIDQVFYMCDGKRTSTKPIYKKDFAKALSKEKMTNFIQHLLTVLMNP
jgi:hypothetical protein